MKPFSNNLSSIQSGSTTLSSSQNNKDPSLNLLPSYVNEAFDAIEGVFHYLSTTEKIELLIKNTFDASKPTTCQLGSVILIYLYINKHTEIVQEMEPSLLNLCVMILRNYTKYNELFLIAALDIISYINNVDFIIANTDLITLFLTDINYPVLQESAFNCLFHCGYKGISLLINVANKYPAYQQFILTKLLDTPHIQHIIIVRELINEFYTKDSKRINFALAALNRLYWIVHGEDNIEFAISELFNNQKINKNLIASTLRTSGVLGTKMISGLARNHKDFSVRSAICKALGHVLTAEKIKLIEIKLLNEKAEFNPRKSALLRYKGSDIPVCSSEFDNDKTCEGYIEVNADEFLASLNRMLTLEYNHSNPILNRKQQTINSIFSYSNMHIDECASQFYPLSTHIDEIRNKEELSQEIYTITPEIINAFTYCVKDKQPLARISAITSLGQLASYYPSTQFIQKSLTVLLSQIKVEKDNNVLSSLLTSISFFDLSSHIQEINQLIFYYLQSSNQLLVQSSLCLIPQLRNCLNDASIEKLKQYVISKEVNKIKYARALLLSGDKGENILIHLMDKDDYKLQTSIAGAFAYTKKDSSNIDFIIEALLKKKNSPSQLVRKSVIDTLKILSEYKSANIKVRDYISK